MRRRSFSALAFVFIGAVFAGLVLARSTGNALSGSLYALVAASHFALAAYYRLHPEPMERPDESVPRRWFELVGVCLASLLLAIGGFVAVTGSL